jgi:ubiquinone biosynthesis monooxygenase Coq7
MPRKYFHSKKSIIDEILRVNHAGEFGAVNIYKGQIASCKTDLLEEMLSHEKIHLEFFEKEILYRDVRPTILTPLWRFGGYMMGRITALMGQKTAMLCTEAVEEVINQHYLDQKSVLIQNKEKNLAKKVEEFRQDELQHRDIALEYGSKEAPIYGPIKFFISNVCKAAISLSKVF